VELTVFSILSKLHNRGGGAFEVGVGELLHAAEQNRPGLRSRGGFFLWDVPGINETLGVSLRTLLRGSADL